MEQAVQACIQSRFEGARLLAVPKQASARGKEIPQK
jgi:hypothetical protein